MTRADDAVDAAHRGDTAALAALVASDGSLRDVVGAVATWDGDLTPLLAAALMGHVETVRWLLDAGADPNESRVRDARAVRFAVGGDHQEVARVLIDRGAEVDVATAAGLRDVSVLAALLRERPASHEEALHVGASPLHYAVTPEAVDLLVDHGADLEARDDYHGNTAYAWARHNARADVCARLLERGARLDAFDAAFAGDLGAVHRALDERPEARERRSHDHDLRADGGPLLHAAARGGQLAVVRLLLERGADPAVRGGPPLEATALHWAAWENQPEIVATLLAAGAPTDVRDASHDATPREWATFRGAAAALAAFDA